MGIDLFISTATINSFIGCFTATGQLLFFEQWQSNQNEGATVLPQLKQHFQAQDLSFTNLKNITVIQGPGSFTGLRIGITIANILAFSTGAQLHQLDLFTYLKTLAHHSVPLESKDFSILIKAGHHQVYLKHPEDKLSDLQILPINEHLIPQLSSNIVCELTPTQIEKILSMNSNQQTLYTPKNLLSPSEIYFRLPKTAIDLVKPLYIKKPHITPSKKTSFFS